MTPEQPLSDPQTLPEPATSIATGLAGQAHTEYEEWALIRYVGSPIGEVLHFQGPELLMGRSADNAIDLADPEVSRKHARLHLVPVPDGGLHVEIEDMGSTNGTFINGKRLHSAQGRVALCQGDVVRVGGHAFKLKCFDGLEQHYHQVMLTRATVDPLTGVSNRTTVLGFLEKQFELAQRYRRPLSVLLCDLDGFKQVNDTFGHAAGDGVLQRFGSILTGRLRGSDQGGRIGGEEFLVVLPETTDQEARKVAEDLRKAVQGECMASSDRHPFSVTCSFGVTQIQEGDSDAGALLARADVALYHAKRAGSNRVEGPARR